MNFDNILANPPYGKIGCDITKKVIEQNPDSNYAMLGTRSAFKKYYDKLACQFVQIGQYELGTNKKLDWGVAQAILLATNGWTEVVDNRKKVGENKVGIEHMAPSSRCFQAGRISHLVGMGIGAISPQAYTDMRTSHLVGVAQSPCTMYAQTHLRSTTLVQANDVKLRNGYIYVSFETFEEACECAIDIISWTDPTDSHYRCIRWGFVCGLVPHYKRKENYDL